MSQSDPQKITHNAVVLYAAAQQGNIDLIKQILSDTIYHNIERFGIGIKNKNNGALDTAAEYGYTEIVKLLIPISNPKLHMSFTIAVASHNKHTEIVKLLIPVSNIKAAFLTADEQALNTECLTQCLQEYEMEQQHKKLTDTLQDEYALKPERSEKRKI